jgi:ATP-dependent DNA helicase DinG
MRDVIVALDIETTGLDKERDAIIEIGAVRFRGDEVLDNWETLVNPERPLPAYIERLTGITQAEVDDAPLLYQVLPQLTRFVGDAPILGHNVSFDLGFLRQHRILAHNQSIDTYELASVLLPNAARYNLGALATALGIPLLEVHRALADARTTHSLFVKLWEHAMHMPLDTLAEIARASRHVSWDGALFFDEVMRQRSREVFTTAQARQPASDAEAVELLVAPEAPPQPLRPRRETIPIDVDAVAALIEEGGRLAEHMPGYEHRPQQVEMLRAVGRAFNEGRHLIVEAGTGVGKGLAYLLPAINFAVQNDERVVVSTNTINLQEQLINKDIPLLRQVLGVPFRVAVLKGRNNYLCPRRLAALRRRGPTSPEEMRVLAKLLVWLDSSDLGERSEISLRGPAEEGVWWRLSAEDQACTLERCQTQMGGACPFYRARLAAESAHILIVNHALLLADVVTENRVLPNYRYLIVDEAHHLEDATTNGLSFRTDPLTIGRLLADLGGPSSGLLGDILAQTEETLPPEYVVTLTDYANLIADAAKAMGHHVGVFFNTLRAFLEDHVYLQRSEYTMQIRVLAALRRQPAWSQVEDAWDNLSKFTSTIANAMRELTAGLANLGDYDIPEYDDLLSGANASARHLDELHNRLNEMVNEPDGNTIYWVEIQPDGERMSVHTAPLDVGPLVQQHLWYAKDTVVLTSATLQTDSGFQFIRERLDADEVDALAVGSPFDYERSTLVYVVNDMPEPDDRHAYQEAIEQGLIELCRATQGRALVLFTSYTQLRQTSNAIAPALERDGIVIYEQGGGSSRSQLLEDFIESEKAVLLGTRSFWEGVDVPGQDLSVLVIVRLPFSVPSEPIFAARSETFEQPFMEYAVPETILRFRQGFGRLIRRKDDRGVVAIFDRRVISKQYGRLFLEALPRCTMHSGLLSDLPDEAVRWLEAG